MSNKFDITQIKFHVRRLTAEGEWIEAAEATLPEGKHIGKDTTFFRMLDCAHSPIQCQWYRVNMLGIPSFVSTHYVRHKIGISHYVRSLRDDHFGHGDEDRNTPVRHLADINAQAFLNISHARLCLKSHKKTVIVWQNVVNALAEIEPDLSALCYPMCVFRGRECHEMHYCGRPGIKHVNVPGYDRHALYDKPCTGGACSI